jgi:hypothetical protein
MQNQIKQPRKKKESFSKKKKVGRKKGKENYEL